MNDYIKLAWRNLWRNKRRTLITAASIFFGVVLSSFMSSMQEGSYAQYIKAIVNFYSGYIQIHEKGYWDEKVINNTLEYSLIKTKLRQVKGITIATPRLENYALASSEEITKGVVVIGIAPQREDSITTLSKKIVKGRYLKNGDNGVLVGSTLAKYLNLTANDTLVLLSQGYHGTSAAGKYPVRGIIKQPSPELDRTVVYMDITNCQELFSARDRLTSLVIMVKNPDDVLTVKDEIASKIGHDFEIMDWKQLNSMLLKEIESDRAGNVITKGILYMVIAFGIFGTITMMTIERKREFGIITAIGMQKYKLSYILMMETILLGLIGAITGIAASIPIIFYFSFHPIPLTGQAAETMLQMGFEPVMSFSVMPSIFYNQALTIFIFTLIIGLYPVFNISRLKINKALRS
ncbi:MAG: ABC transporter permease [Bacteroidota bacterium]|nr:ABC transporter permease [Bacteroidota bacterium]